MQRELDDVLSKSECLYSQAEVESALTHMAHDLDERLKGTTPVFLCIMIGAMIPAGFLLSRMRTFAQVAYIHATRYDGKTEGGRLTWRYTPSISLKDRVVVVFDDILDLGITLKAAIDFCKAEGAKEVITAVLVDKKVTRDAEGLQKADFSALYVENDYVFGYGLDYQEYLRNLPGVYRLKREK